MPPQVAFTPNTAPATSAAAAVRTSMTASASYASRSVQQQQQVHHGGQQQQQGLYTPVMQHVPTTAASPQYQQQQQPGMVGHASATPGGMVPSPITPNANIQHGGDTSVQRWWYSCRYTGRIDDESASCRSAAAIAR